MPPNSIDLPPMGPDPRGFMQGMKPSDQTPIPPKQHEERYALMLFQSAMNLLAHILIGMTVAICLLFAFRGSLPLGSTPLHIVLCVLGYQLLMAQAILGLSNQNGSTSRFRLIDQRRFHWILQIMGSGLAIAGSFIKILDKNRHWHSLHGKFGLVALVFTVVSLVNGLSSLWAYELRRFLPSNLSKLTHICFGTVAFAAAGICLCYGMDHNMFRNWATNPLTDTFIAFVVIMTAIVILNPLLTLFTKTKKVVGM